MAKVDVRKNRAEMPERRNVLRKVISPTVTEVAVEIKTETPEVHYLKVQGLFEEGRKEVPFLRLKGKWMREAGIVEDSYVSVTVMEGLLLIRRVRSKVG
ncbi:SymE family type I addiction module toxin [Odoribacter sp. Z80]|uniref:SymE family type I addiction module toxin n=1 Tax=Odoribacter sp. Z80 TaxID=2304575 RepID=UPI00137A9835|nr:SymE family type I addiction module toxin [Odoribacter sp. Z80]NCE71865.1 type I addiction module toxin, SymE family [Odoribacter sp. Z80]